ncbi:MAG: hypothetical protein HN411_02290 [Waddliaceae bacterium]|jgi:uncharacterized membrane protein YwaF|nr:hypothetical protein [Waddliaceae bacterium]MBT4445067.1 hypothetical protein [Waddliaceae bacterium]MBT7264366.1 hypothetical protein [Waddliaceae bacterium]
MEEIKKEIPMTVWNWIVTWFIMAIPVVNLIMLFVWAFSKKTKISKSTWAKALLLLALIGILIFLLIFVIGTSYMTIEKMAEM